MEVFGYRKLIAYQKAKEVVKRTYKLLKKFPAEERYAMCDQLRRASVSITSNIAEGINRYSVKDKSHFIEMSYGSLMEVSSQMEIAEELGYITATERLSMDQLIEEVPSYFLAYRELTTLNQPLTLNSKRSTLNFIKMERAQRYT